MKRTLLIFFLTFAAISALPQKVDLIFQKGNDAYKEGNYEEAIEHYMKIISLGYESPGLYFNLANSYYKYNQIAPAIYYYEKALKLNPNYEDAKVNLKIARRMTLDRFDPLPMTFFQRFAERVIYARSSDFWAVNTILFALLAVVAFFYYYFGYTLKRQKTGLIASITGLLLFLITLFFAIKTSHYEKHRRPAIIFAHKTGVYSEPDPASTLLYDIHEGTKILLEEKDGDWCKVRLPDGNKGWVICESFKEY